MSYLCIARSIFRVLNHGVLVAVSAAVTLSMTPAHADEAEHLQYVPADTMFYFGSLKPYSVAQWVEFFSAGEEGRMSDMMEQVIEQQQRDAKTESPMSDMVNNEAYTNFMRQYGEFLDNPEENFARYGINAQAMSFSMYMNGVSPVLRVQLDDKDQFLAAVAELDAENGYEPVMQTVSDTDVRLYDVFDDPQAPRLAVSVVGDDAVLGLSFSDSDLLQGLGLESVTNSLAATKSVQGIQDKYSYTSDMVGFFDFRNLVKMLTDAESESGKQCMTMLPAEGKNNISALRTPECRSEMASLADIWPRMVFGYQALDMTDNKALLDTHFALEINHPGITGALSKLRGHIPQSVQGADSMFSFALGVDVSSLGAAVGELAGMLSSAKYTCSGLSGMNVEPQMVQQAVMGVNMMSGMAQGVRGLSMSFFDMDFEMPEGESPKVNNVDAIINIPALNPQMLLNMAKAVPQLAQFTVPDDGTPVEIGQSLSSQMGMPMDVDVNVAQRGKQIVLFSGEQGSSLADDTTAAIEDNNGFFMLKGSITGLSEFYSRFGDMMGDEGKQVSDQMQVMKDFYDDGDFGYFIDFTDNGVEFNVLLDFVVKQ